MSANETMMTIDDVHASDQTDPRCDSWGRRRRPLRIWGKPVQHVSDIIKNRNEFYNYIQMHAQTGTSTTRTPPSNSHSLTHSFTKTRFQTCRRTIHDADISLPHPLTR